jgi:hypothetical protein
LPVAIKTFVVSLNKKAEPDACQIQPFDFRINHPKSLTP